MGWPTDPHWVGQPNLQCHALHVAGVSPKGNRVSHDARQTSKPEGPCKEPATRRDAKKPAAPRVAVGKPRHFMVRPSSRRRGRGHAPSSRLAQGLLGSHETRATCGSPHEGGFPQRRDGAATFFAPAHSGRIGGRSLVEVRDVFPEPGNGSWTVCRQRALTRRNRCRILVRRVRGPGLLNRRPRPQGEVLDFDP